MAQVRRLTGADIERGRVLFGLIAAVFETEAGPLSDAYLARWLGREDLWALEASVEGRCVGGLTAHTLPMTRAEAEEILLYDIAVLPEFQRQGIGGQLVAALREQAGGRVLFVLADNEDEHALDFYRALGGEGAAVTAFTWG